MRCVKCDEPISQFGTPCPHCHFDGNPILVEELVHIQWLLAQFPTLNTMGVQTVRLEQHYNARRRELETQLGLRLPSLTPAQLREFYAALAHNKTLLRLIQDWSSADWLQREQVEPILAEIHEQIRELQRQLDGYTFPTYPQSDADRLEVIEFLLDAVRRIGERNGFVSADAQERARASLLAEREKIEIKLGLRRPQPVPAAPVEERKAPQAPSPVASVAPAPQIPQAPPVPLVDRFWKTLLSERTLQAMLFLGIFLLFSAAVSFVVWGWEEFSAPLRVAIPTGFTFLFLGLGWYVRKQTRMYRSGIALTAIAALLIPIDFYTLYINFDIPPENTPLFWFITSLACLGAYLAITLSTQSGLFGYLVGAAAGGTVLSFVEIGHQHFALSQDWNPAALTTLAVGLLLIATALSRSRASRWRVLAEPFRNLALIAAGAIMLLSFGWRSIDRKTFDALHYSMTISWWLGGFIFGWGAIHYRSRTLGILTAIALPVATFMAQAAQFDQARISPAWHAFGLALLVPLYLTTGWKLLTRVEDEVLYGHGRTATGWGIALAIFAALVSLTNFTSSASAAATHAVLCGAALLAMFLWQQPRILYAASLLAITTSAFVMTELGLAPRQFSIGWASLSILFIVLAVANATRLPAPENSAEDEQFAGRLTNALVNAGFVIAALALLPALIPYDGNMLVYALGNWLGLAGWAAWRAHTGQPGFATRGWLGLSRFHWMTALPLPLWILVLFANRGPLGYDLPLASSALAWGMVALSYRLRTPRQSSFSADGQHSGKPFPTSPEEMATLRSSQQQPLFAFTEDAPWYIVGLFVSVLAPVAAFAIEPNGYTPAICILAAGLLYLTDAISKRQRWELAPGAWVVAWGLAWLLDRAGVRFDAVTFTITVLIAAYVCSGLWAEHRQSRKFTQRFLTPLFWASHIMTLLVLLRGLNSPLVSLIYRAPWTQEMQLWQAASLLLLGGVYALYAWGTLKERWAHAAAWLLAAGGGLVAISLSTSSGRLAAEAAAGAMAYVLGERALFWLRRTDHIDRPIRAMIRVAWRLYRRPLLAAGWIASVAAITLALVRNLVLLRAGHTQQVWAAIGLTMIVALYALSARMFRQTRFVWLAAFLAFLPWTIMTNLGWLVAERPRTTAFALSWMALAWLLYLIAAIVRRSAPAAYALPLRVVAHLLVPFSLLWGVADPDTSRLTYALGSAFYALESMREAWQLKRDATIVPSTRHTAFLYPALGLVPIWCAYLLNLLPGARHEHYGLMLLIFGMLGIVLGQVLESIAPRAEVARSFGLPAYLTGYVAMIVGTLLIAHDPGLLSLALLYDALLLLASAWLFKHPLWAFAAAAVAPFSFWLALNQSDIPGNRHGWWLMALAAAYLLIAWALRRARLAPYSTAPLAIAFALIAFALPPSTQDKVGAFWGYSGAAMLYAVSAFWLRQPLLLTPACALALVPYAIGLQESPISLEYYGLALFPLALVSLATGWLLDVRMSGWKHFPWAEPRRWGIALAERLLGWWGLPLHALGFGLAVASPFFANGKAGLAALSCLFAMLLGAWSIYRFRLRGWLVATAVAGHAAALLYLSDLGWSRFPADLALRFLPITLLTTLVALAIERWRHEIPPLRSQTKSFDGWSHPLYFVVLVDVIAAQVLGLSDANAGWLVSLVHALLVAALGSRWLARELPPLSAFLGIVALVQYMTTQPGPEIQAPIPLAQLALAYGMVGCGLAFWRVRTGIPTWLEIWERPLQWSGLLMSYGVLVLAAVLGLDLAQWTVRAMLGLPFRQIVDMPTVQMVVGVLALSGLLYLAAAFIHRRPRAGYVAVAILLVAWSLHAFYVQAWDGATNVQWYALPAGLYLLSISFLESQRGNVHLARWVDYAAVVLMMGSLFWQTLLFGWSYALVLGTEGFGALWWGSARRLRRFLYAGMMGVVLATLAQLINSLQSVNQWVVFGTIGLTVVLTAIVVERKMEEIKAFRQILETWE